MAESMLGKWFYFCNCGPGCGCGFRSERPESCPCGEVAVPRRVLMEDERNVYVCETGKDVEPRNEIGSAPFTGPDGRPLQSFPKAQAARPRTIRYRGRVLTLTERGDECEVEIEGKRFRARRHAGAHVGWMGFPCYVMYPSPLAFARTLVDFWHVVGDDEVLAPPRESAPVHDHTHASAHDHTHANGGEAHG